MAATTVSSIIGSSGLLPSGTIIPHAGVMPPNGFLLCDGTSYLRTGYPSLFSSITLKLTAATTSASTSVTVADTSKLAVGWGVEGTGIGAGITIASILNATTVVLSGTATATSANSTLTFLPYGRTSITSFSVPDARGVFLRGAGTNGVSNYGGVSGHTPAAGAVGAKGGQKTAKNGLRNAPSDTSGSFSTGVASNSSWRTGVIPGGSPGGQWSGHHPSRGSSLSGFNGDGTFPGQDHTHAGFFTGVAEAQSITSDAETTPAYFAVNHIIKI